MIKKCYVIPVEKACNDDCVFCISKTRDYNKGCSLLKVDEKLLENIKLFKRRGIKKFEITGGGEPFLNANLEEIVYIIKTIIPDSYIKLYTNGNILRSIPLIDELDISVCHYDKDINSKFMRSIVNIDILDKLKFFRSSNSDAKIRLSIPLIKGAIDSAHELDVFVNKTREYVDEYVVRTLYPGTIDLENLYVDFDYSRENVIFERDNNVSGFDGLIMWSDGKFYRDWSLEKERYLQSYLLLKSDARTYINEIESVINSEGFDIVKRLLLNDFINQSEMLYKDKTADYLKIVKRHLFNLSYLFGNEGMIYVLDLNGEGDLYKRTVELKEKIRKMYSFTHHLNGFVSRDNALSHLNLVHAPDANMNLFDDDLNLINGMGLREIKEDEMKLVRRYRSFSL